MGLPSIGLGTWNLKGTECTAVVQAALSMGYRHIDTAQAYGNQEAIGKALIGMERTSIYITSKIALREQIDPANLERSVQNACETALRELQTDYLDLYLIHAPDRSFPLETIFTIMQELIYQGKTRKIGVSNYTLHHLQDLAAIGQYPYANQVEFHPYLHQKALWEYCQAHQIKLISFRPFGKGKLLTDNPIFNLIGKKYDRTAAQVILRWLIQKEIAVIPKASSTHHLKENLAIFDFTLSVEDMLCLDNLHQNRRYCRPNDPEYDY